MRSAAIPVKTCVGTALRTDARSHLRLKDATCATGCFAIRI